MVMEGDLTWGGEHAVQCKDYVLWNCAPETCKLLLISVIPINSMKRKKKEQCLCGLKDNCEVKLFHLLLKKKWGTPK